MWLLSQLVDIAENRAILELRMARVEAVCPQDLTAPNHLTIVSPQRAWNPEQSSMNQRASHHEQPAQICKRTIFS